jgi:Domain of unknown function (DUF309).
VRDRLRAGAALYNAGHRHAAHDCWEDHWLDLRDTVADDDGPDPPATVRTATPDDEVPVPSVAADERLLHGLIQFTAAVHHHENGNRAGTRGLAEGVTNYLGPLPADYRDCSLTPLREWAATLVAGDGARPEGPPPLRHEGTAVDLADLRFEAAALAAPVVAEATGFDPDPVAAGAEYAREAVAESGTSRFVTLVLDFVTDRERGIAHQRLSSLVARRRRRDRDVDGLF